MSAILSAAQLVAKLQSDPESFLKTDVQQLKLHFTQLANAKVKAQSWTVSKFKHMTQHMTKYSEEQMTLSLSTLEVLLDSLCLNEDVKSQAVQDMVRSLNNHWLVSRPFDEFLKKDAGGNNALLGTLLDPEDMQGLENLTNCTEVLAACSKIGSTCFEMVRMATPERTLTQKALSHTTHLNAAVAALASSNEGMEGM